jgi:uncharacterized protein (TIGR02246 family)
MTRLASIGMVLAMCVALMTQALEAQTKTPPSGKPSPTYPAPVAQKSDPALEQLSKDFEAAFNKGDAKALAALYTADAFHLAPNNQVLHGRAAIEKFYVTSFADATKPPTLSLQPGRTQMLTSDVALTEGTYELVGAAVTKAIYVLTMVRQGEQWRLASVVPVPDR